MVGFRLLMETSPDAIFVARVSSDMVVDVNDAAVSLLGFARESILGRRPSELPFEWSNGDSREHFIRTVLHEGSVRDTRHAFRTAGGDYRVAQLSAYRTRLEGELYIVFIARDITETQQIRHFLDQSEQRFRRLFTQMVSGYVLLEYAPRRPLEPPTLYCVEANPAFARLTGLAVHEIASRALADILGTRERTWVEPLEEVVITGRPAYFVKFSRRLRKWFEVSAYQPSPGQVACTFVDVTDRRRAQREVVRARAALEQANLTKDRFIATLSHELRTPLMPILAAVSALESDPSLSLAVKEDLALIRRNAEMEARLIEGLLDLTQFSGGGVQLRAQTLDLQHILRDAAHAAAALIEAHGLSLDWSVNTTDRMVHVDAPRMRQVFSNLLKNAIDHTPPNGKISLCIETRPGNRIAVIVRDSGEGISKEMLARIFDAFHQGAHRPGSRHGTLGLGLTLCRSIVELHGGRVDAQSDGPGRGSCFTVILPLVRESHGDPDATNRSSHRPSSCVRRVRESLV